ncbi:DUF945 domain-containing protein [Bizionia gelidisalsuginis]|uniref:DUF945 domain-containing protein n=1 Tax=Bizionia gelidisalsuginis TaxID=291188 RepID=A0ABY3M8N5_9FLAO|nr:DUF932 domain-containing protein [Bizionia gelidisalsuginis]TYC10593.1 DUF945 domain-containing protein [Bizionia gelidisalsuginis]
MYLQKLQQDDIFVSNEMKSLESITGMKSRKGLENAIISNGKIVNVVSKSYGHIPNELFFTEAERMLVESNLKYRKRTINKNDRSFITDFIIDDENQFSLKNKEDRILPMLRFKNSYDSSEKTSGHFGFYREVCTNGLHISKTEVDFSIRHTKNGLNLLMPKLNRLFDKFLENEYYEVTQKFNDLIEVEITNTEKFVEEVLERTNLFKYESGRKNKKPSNKSIEVLQILHNEPLPAYEKSNLWLGYNAFNWVLHNTLKKTFSQQERLDKKLFDEVYEMV